MQNADLGASESGSVQTTLLEPRDSCVHRKRKKMRGAPGWGCEVCEEDTAEAVET